ncbi:YcaO-like family protein [Roseobacter sp. YSTF-M11]|uniref:YcaO-like family protein n=1 Tax=Roseobacter insulae TaxID=2859783 RepID=A0A9X1FV07_9RHOB|nr:YcaO-like family protein [Roseobacter insulae]MBW4707378.1 YcaO-like family protein [Roseobacter insulae]
MDFSGGEKIAGSGLQRVCSAEETLARILPIKHKFGITRVANVTGLDRIFLPVVMAIRPNARSIAISQGKGTTLAHAKASALMEAIEIWHAEHVDREVYFASADDLAVKYRFVDLDRLPATPDKAFKRTMRMHWVMAHDLMSGQEKLVPLEMVHADYTHPVSTDAGVFPASTNGLASGNHILEAVCHAICEVIERDALAVWHHQPQEIQRASRIDLSSIEDVELITSLRKVETAGLDCAVWDVTSDVGVATFLCVITDPASQGEHLGLGSGTHPNPKVALHRALNEAAQTRLNYISGAREDLFHIEYSADGRDQKVAAYSHLFGAQQDVRPFAATAGVANRDLRQDLEWLKDRLRAAGVAEVAVADLTREDCQIPVVRVIIPGLEAPHDDDAYVPGLRVRGLQDQGMAK